MCVVPLAVHYYGGHLGVEAGVLVGVDDVDGLTRGRHQLGDAVVDQPIGVGRFIHAVFGSKR